MMGRRSPDFPDDLAERLRRAANWTNLLPPGPQCGDAGHAQFELADLWEEATEEGETNEWLAAMTGLIDRLNPDVEPDALAAGGLLRKGRSRR